MIIHETFRVLGIGSNSTTWNNQILTTTVDEKTVKQHFYTGLNGISEYKNLLLDLSYNTPDFINSNIYLIPLENSTGSEYNFLEEGSGDPANEEHRFYPATDNSDNLYPYFPNEIMTKTVEDTTFISRITLGMLKDLGYEVNFDSEYLSKPILYQGAPQVPPATPFLLTSRTGLALTLYIKSEGLINYNEHNNFITGLTQKNEQGKISTFIVNSPHLSIISFHYIYYFCNILSLKTCSFSN